MQILIIFMVLYGAVKDIPWLREANDTPSHYHHAQGNTYVAIYAIHKCKHTLVYMCIYIHTLVGVFLVRHAKKCRRIYIYIYIYKSKNATRQSATVLTAMPSHA